MTKNELKLEWFNRLSEMNKSLEFADSDTDASCILEQMDLVREFIKSLDKLD